MHSVGLWGVKHTHPLTSVSKTPLSLYGFRPSRRSVPAFETSETYSGPDPTRARPAGSVPRPRGVPSSHALPSLHQRPTKRARVSYAQKGTRASARAAVLRPRDKRDPRTRRSTLHAEVTRNRDRRPFGPPRPGKE